VTVPAAELRTLSATILSAVGVPTPDADLVADSLVMADLWGHQSHGVLRLGWYVEKIRRGTMQPATAPEVVRDTGPVVVINGHDGVGQVVAAHAAGKAVALAKLHGVGVVGVRQSNHFGAAGYFTRMAARADCIGILTTNSSPAMAPWLGRDKAVGSNPWSIAAPRAIGPDLVLDISNTVVARGKIYLARQRGEAIPEGWALDVEGAPTTDPTAAVAGSLLPIGGHKGFAIALLMDVLSGVLTGSAFGTEVAGPYEAERRSGSGHLFIALDVEAFFPDRREFHRRMDDLISAVKSVRPSAPGRQIMVPGEMEDANAERNSRTGLQLPRQTLRELRHLAESVGVPFPDSIY